MSNQYQSFCENLTASLFDIIDAQASLLTWQKGWDDQGTFQVPVGHSGRYHGANVLNLLIDQIQKGFKSNQWYTFNQIRQMGASVQKGAKSTQVCFWKTLSDSDDSQSDKNDEGQQEEETKRSRFIVKIYPVFNADQTTLEPVIYPTEEFKSEAVQALLSKHKVEVSHYGNKAHFTEQNDVITIPRPDQFFNEYNYNATLLHELVHWTGNKIDGKERDCFKNYAQSDAARAEEELVAEIGSLLLATHFRLKGTMEGHASYVSSWKKHLKPQEVMRAASQASKAFEFLIGDNL